MSESYDNIDSAMRRQAAIDVIKYFNPDRTIFYFDNQYHRVIINDRIKEIPSAEAEELLLNPEWDLWNMGCPAGPLPYSCPSYMYSICDLNIRVGEYLQMIFEIYARVHGLNQIQNN